MKSRIAALLAWVLVSPAISHPQEAKRGHLKETFAEKHPLSTLTEWCKRNGWTFEGIKSDDDKGGQYEIAQESFEVYLPQSYDGTLPHGLFVFISAGAGGAPEKEWPAVLDKHGLIFVGANNSGNERKIWYRANLALDAVHNMTKRYRIDPERVYVGGSSGGGRMASQVGVAYADVFTGGFFMIGCDYFRNVDVIGGGRYWKASFPAPAAGILEKARTKGRYVIFTGDKDMNQPSSIAMYENGFKKDSFAYVQYYEAKNWGHTPPNGEWFAKGVQSLDAPLASEAPTLYAQAQRSQKAGKTKPAFEAYLRAAAHGRTHPFFADARSKAAELRPKVEAEGKDAFAKLKASNPPAPKLRDFARDWAGYEAGRTARDEANGLGEKEFEKATAKTGAALRAELQKLLAAWDGYPVAATALKALDDEAQKEYDKIATIDSERARHQKLIAFAKVWAPSTVAARAREVVEAEASQQLADIRKLATDREKIARLQVFVQIYAETTPGAQAKALLDRMTKK